MTIRKSVVGPLVVRLENISAEPKSDLRKRRLKNAYAEAAYHQIPLRALRLFIQTRKRIRLAHQKLDVLPPHLRVQILELAHAMGDTSELFQFPTQLASPDDLQALR